MLQTLLPVICGVEVTDTSGDKVVRRKINNRRYTLMNADLVTGICVTCMPFGVAGT